MASPSRATVRNLKAGDGRGQGRDQSEGDKVQLYTHAQLVAQSNAMIGPWLVEQAKRQIAEPKSQHLHKSRSAEPQGLSLCETLERNGAAK